MDFPSDGRTSAGGGDGPFVYRRGRNEPASAAVVLAVSAVAGVCPSDLPPLHHAVDTDALDDLFAARLGGTPRSGVVSFEYAGHEAVIDDDRVVVYVPRDG